MSADDRIKLISTKVLHDGWAKLKSVTFDWRRRDGVADRLTRLTVDRGDAAAVLPYDPDRGTVLMLRQFRLPAYLKGHAEPLLEVCAGRIEDEGAELCARREALEELGCALGAMERVFVTFSSPALDMETITGFIARYRPADRVADGGGLADEGEDIEVLEMPFAEAFAGIAGGVVVDAKTILLLQHLKLSGLMGCNPCLGVSE